MGDRKARLAALAAKAGRTKPARVVEETEEGDNENAADESKAISFRNYAPKDATLEGEQQQETEEPPSKRMKLPQEGPSALDQALEEAQQDLAQSTPQDRVVPTVEKINADLKRNIEAKLKKLERRTQKAIVELLKERLDKEAAQEASEEEVSSELD